MDIATNRASLGESRQAEVFLTQGAADTLHARQPLFNRSIRSQARRNGSTLVRPHTSMAFSRPNEEQVSNSNLTLGSNVSFLARPSSSQNSSRRPDTGQRPYPPSRSNGFLQAKTNRGLWPEQYLQSQRERMLHHEPIYPNEVLQVQSAATVQKTNSENISAVEANLAIDTSLEKQHTSDPNETSIEQPQSKPGQPSENLLQAEITQQSEPPQFDIQPILDLTSSANDPSIPERHETRDISLIKVQTSDTFSAQGQDVLGERDTWATCTENCQEISNNQ